MSQATTAQGEPSARQRYVLDAVLALMVEKGADGLTMTAVANRASCSKETLYKWFGDRSGLLAATVQWQASQVRASEYDSQHLDVGALKASLETFAANWLRVIASDTSIALNRIAIGSAASPESDLGSIVLQNGRFALGERLKPLLESASAAELIEFEDADTAFRTFFGLVGRDVQIRLLLGDKIKLSETEIQRDAVRATQQFLTLHRVGGMPA